jgi:hypothetical protein
MDSRAAIRSQKLRTAAFFVEVKGRKRCQKTQIEFLGAIYSDLGALAHQSHLKGGELLAGHYV